MGCLGRLSSFSETEEGHYLITLTGLARFRVIEELEMRRGYRRVRADFSAYRSDLDLTPQPIGVERKALLAALRGFFSSRGFNANWDVIEKLDDDMLVITLATVCPFEPAERRRCSRHRARPNGLPRCLLCCKWQRSRRDAPGGRSVS